jgi:KUP system potassium uptake protein
MAQSVVPSEGAEASPTSPELQAQSSSKFVTLTLGSIGVVYGDIGTSPLYAFREALLAAGGGGASREAVYGVLSLILWALILIVTCKYVVVLLRADNNGEGGPLSLMALASRVSAHPTTILYLGVVGASLFFGDALITPSISVLSAIEGIRVATDVFDHYVVVATVVILVFLFAVQSRGTASVAGWFGPIMVVWFVVIGVGGLSHLLTNPQVLTAFNPVHGIEFLLHHGFIGFVTLGAVFLAVTGAEALYADLGHFGRKPIRTAWLGLVLPALALNYLGQAALVLADPAAIENPFFLLFPHWALIPMVGLATVATVIASQAVITGAFSLTRQAVQLGLLPRLEVRHTSAEHEGQIYLPLVNTLLLIGVLLLVGLFRSSSALASAYGIAVTGTMVVTACMAFLVIWKVWKWSLWLAAALMAPFLVVDTTFLTANLIKIIEGGWVPLAFAAALSVVMYTWHHGTRLLFEKTRKLETPLGALVEMLEKKPPVQVPGTAVFLTSDPTSAPTALLHSLKHYKVLHDKNVILTIRTTHTPRVAPEERVKIEQIGKTFSCVSLKFGFMETPNVPRALGIARKHGWQFDIMSTSFFVSRRLLKPAARPVMPAWQDRLFISLTRIANDATSYYQIPTGRVVEIGTQVTI